MDFQEILKNGHIFFSKIIAKPEDKTFQKIIKIINKLNLHKKITRKSPIIRKFISLSYII